MPSSRACLCPLALLLRAAEEHGDTDRTGPQPNPAALTRAPILLRGVHGIGLLFFLVPRSLLPLHEGSEAAGQRDQHAAVLGWHHVLQKPRPQELQRKTRQFTTAALPLRSQTERMVCFSLSLGRCSAHRGEVQGMGKNALKGRSGRCSGAQGGLPWSSLSERRPASPRFPCTGLEELVPPGFPRPNGLLPPARHSCPKPRYSAPNRQGSDMALPVLLQQPPRTTDLLKEDKDSQT